MGAAIRQYGYIVNGSEVMQHGDIYWKSCVKLGKLLDTKQNVSYLMNHYYKEAVVRIIKMKSSKLASNVYIYYEHQLDWIQVNVESEIYEKMVRLLFEIMMKHAKLTENDDDAGRFYWKYLKDKREEIKQSNGSMSDQMLMNICMNVAHDLQSEKTEEKEIQILSQE